jgi:hypothetical protein
MVRTSPQWRPLQRALDCSNLMFIEESFDDEIPIFIPLPTLSIRDHHSDRPRLCRLVQNADMTPMLPSVSPRPNQYPFRPMPCRERA